MRLIFTGPPGSGKGTQAKLLSQRLGLVHFSTGDIIRDAIAHGTPEGRRAQAYVHAGQLVPDDVVNDIVNSRLRAPDRPARFIMDGYPRSLGQAESFDALLKELNLPLDAVLFLNVDDGPLIDRLSARWTCPNPTCKATYNTLSKPPRRPGVCDECGTALVQRDDDRPATIRRRLKVFHEGNDELMAHYRRQGLVIDVPGAGDIETIYQNIVSALPRPSPNP
ncbi:MAG: adenylate kinase [Gemmataceae bacterium]|nr:adenylate kinase [Gemmataceae bacterium]